MSACGGLFLLDTGSVTPDSIRGRYDGDDAQPPALIPKLVDNLEQLFSPDIGRGPRMVGPAICRARMRQCRDGRMPWSGHGSRDICVSYTALAKDSFAWAPGWRPNRSHSYGEAEAQIRAKLTEPGPR